MMTGADLKKLRESTNLSQEGFAKKLKLSVAIVRAWEQGIAPIPPYQENYINLAVQKIQERKNEKS